jgi:hypothetical protein
LLAPIVDAAIQRWSLSGTVDAAALAALRDLSFVVADLPDLVLGRADDGVIAIDIDAAGSGWFVDPTPGEDSEFSLVSADCLLLADASSEASGRIDLLTVVMHEMGHLLELNHHAGVMAETLATGSRGLPSGSGSADGGAPAVAVVQISPQPQAKAEGTGPQFHESNPGGSVATRPSAEALLRVDPALAITYLPPVGKQVAGKVADWREAQRVRLFDANVGAFDDLPVSDAASMAAPAQDAEVGPDWLFADDTALSKRRGLVDWD